MQNKTRRPSREGGRDSQVRSLTKALDLMNVMGRRRHTMGVTELAAELDLSKSAVHRLLQTLLAAGFVDQDAMSRQYFLGPRLFVLGKVYESTVTLRGLARPLLERLAQQLGEAVHLSVPARAERGVPSHILLDKIESTYRLTMTPYPGAISPAYCTGSGKVLLAYAMEDALSELVGPLHAYTPNTITDPDLLRAEMAVIRKQGFGMDREELEVGLTCIAGPIFEAKQVVAAVSVSGPTTRLTPDRFQMVTQAVLSTAREISNMLR